MISRCSIIFLLMNSNNYIWPIDMAFSGATTLGQSGHGSDNSEWVLCIPKSCRVTGASVSDCIVAYSGQSLERGVLPLWRDAVGVFCSLCRLSHTTYTHTHIHTHTHIYIYIIKLIGLQRISNLVLRFFYYSVYVCDTRFEHSSPP